MKFFERNPLQPHAPSEEERKEHILQAPAMDIGELKDAKYHRNKNRRTSWEVGT